MTPIRLPPAALAAGTLAAVVLTLAGPGAVPAGGPPTGPMTGAKPDRSAAAAQRVAAGRVAARTGTGRDRPRGFSSPPRPSPGPAPLPGGSLWSTPVVPLRVLRAFEPPAVRWGSGHRGVDLAAQPGAAVLAPRDGVVSFAGVVAGRPVLSIDHEGGIRTTYEAVTPSVGPGDRVRRGEPVATVAAPPHCAAGCVHWGARRGENYLDPLSLLRPASVRLLPLG